MRKVSRLPLMVSIIISPALAQTNEFNHNVFAQFSYVHSEQNSLIQTSAKQVLVTGYLEEVSHGKHPHTQAAFLERAASLTLAHAGIDADYPFVGAIGGSASGIDVSYVTHQHWVVGGGYSKTELKGLYEQDTQRVSLGRYLDDTSRVLLSYADTEQQNVGGSSSHTFTYGLEYKNVILHLDSGVLTLDAKADRIETEAGNGSRYSLAGEYHFTLASSLTVATQFTNGHEEGQRYSFGLNHFFTPFMALGAEYAYLDPSEGFSTDTATLYTRLLF